MPGSKWYSFRQGDRSEYLALYILSALGVVVKVPREEDIGADFHCSLAREDHKRMTFFAPFLVQTKSISDNKIFYGGCDDKGRWKNEEIEWLFGQELPLLVGLVDKDKLILKLYSTSNMWAAHYSAGNVGQVVLLPDVPNKDGEEIKLPKPHKNEKWPTGIGDGNVWEVPLGPPLICISIDDLEDKEKINKYRQMLLMPLHNEQKNITYRRFGVHYSQWPLRVNTNKLESSFPFGVFYAANATPEANTPDQLKSIAPIVATLAFNFKLQEKPDSVEKLKTIVQMIEEEHILRMLKRDVPELFE